MAMLATAAAGCQSTLMAPTEILAEQHYSNVRQMLEGLGVEVELLTGAVRGAREKGR